MLIDSTKTYRLIPFLKMDPQQPIINIHLTIVIESKKSLAWEFLVNRFIFCTSLGLKACLQTESDEVKC